MKIAVITGASSGMGREFVKQVSKKEKFDEKIIKDFNYLKEKLKNTKRYINKFPTMKSHKYKEVIPLLQNDEINSDKKNRHLQE